MPDLVLAAATLLFAAACADEPVAPLDTDHPDTIEADAVPSFAVHLTCAVDVAAGSMECGPSAPSASGTGSAGGPSMNLIVGSQHQFVRMGNDEPSVSDGVWSANITVQNLTLQPMGTTDGSTPEGTGVRVFFVDEPSNGVEVTNHDGAANFLGSEPAKYYGYAGSALGEDEILPPGEVSEAKSWAFELNEATEFVFSVLVAAEVPDTDGYAVGLTRVSESSRHNCAEGSDGKLYCWGFNGNGQLGDGTTTHRTTPVTVQAPAGVALSKVSLGYYNTCAEGDDGELYCWGHNNWGQLGDGTTTDRHLPTVVAGSGGS